MEFIQSGSADHSFKIMHFPFQKVMGRQLEWSEIYAFQKVLPLLTRWQLYQSSVAEVSQSRKGFVVPHVIRKKRNIKSKPSYEILWKDDHDYFRGLFPNEQLEQFLLENNNDISCLWTTIEPTVLVDKVYPHLIVAFEAEKLLAKKTKKAKAKCPASTLAKDQPKRKTTAKKSKATGDSLTNFGDMQFELDSIPVKKTVRKRKAVQKVTVNAFFKSSPAPQEIATRDSSLPLLDPNEDVENVQDLSNLISNIVSRSPMLKRLKGHDLVYAEEFPSEEIVKEVPNQSLDDIDLMIMKRGKTVRPRHKRVSSLRMDIVSSTPNAKNCIKSKDESLREEQTSFFAPALDEIDAFESSYNELINGRGDAN